MPSSHADSATLALSHAALVHRLGGAACIVPLPTSLPGDPLEVGTLAGIPVWSMVASPAVTRHHARRLARRGSLGLLLAEDGVNGHLSLAVTLTPVQVTTTSGAEHSSLVLRRVRRAALGHEHELASAIALAEAIDLDAAGRRTFRLLHALVERATTSLPSRIPLDDRRAWALTQLTRLLFLRFVEAEGWLDGNPRFLAESFGRCLAARRDPTHDLLHPLFFGTLNRPAEARSRLARGFGAIPFLNGGLFEPHPLERRWPMRLSPEYWQEAFSALVDRVDVSLDREVDDGRVTPELLGRVFEGVMDGAERRREGTFFTPPELVEAMSREALACHLAARLGRSEESISTALDDPDPVLRQALLDIRVLDPAAGSGAFLVGMLGLLHGPGTRERRRVNHLVTRRLFGVDRHPGAVRLTELRLWLEVLRAHRGASAGTLPPLPNLDATIRAGDALIDPVLARGLAAADAAVIAESQQVLATTHGVAKRRATRALADAERAVTARAMAAQERLLERRIIELLAAQRSPSLFGERAHLDHPTRQAIRTLRRERATMRDERRRLERQSASGAFAMSVAFAPVLTRRGGFDLVIGNPPWVRAERIPQSVRQQLSARYRWWTSGDGRGWRHLPDLAVAFVERSTQLLRGGGTFALLLPAKLATAGYATAMRAGVATQLTLHRVADLTDDPRAGFEATTYPLAIVASRRVPQPDHAVRLGLERDAPTIPQGEWRNSGSWSTGSPHGQRILARLTARHPALAAQVTAQLGVKTGANAVFLNPPAELAAYCRGAVRGRDVRAFRAESRARLLWPAGRRGEPWHELPAEVSSYLHGEQDRLQRRADWQKGPWWRLFRTTGATAPHRVVWCDLAPVLRATTLTDPDMVPLNSCYVAALPSASSAEALTAWLNSTWIGALARLVAEPASGGCARFAARAVGTVPLPAGVLGDPVLAAMTHAAIDHNVSEALDEYVAQRLGLDTDDRAVLGAVAGPHSHQGAPSARRGRFVE